MILQTLLVLASVEAIAAAPELKMVMADPRLPNKPTTHILDDRVSTGLVENFRELYVNPAQVGKSLEPVGKLGPVGRMLSPAGKRASIPIVNETSSYAEVSVNGVKIGVIDALQNGAIHDVPHGLYEVTFGLQNGYTETRTVHTLHLDEAIIPGGKDVQAALESGYVPSWHATPERGYVVIEPPKPKPKPKPRVRIVGEQIEITEKVMFALNSAEVDGSSFGLLNEVATILLASPQIEQVRVEGHTDAQGNAASNLKLSAERAEAVRTFLVEKGIESGRLVSEGLGSSRPRVEGDTAEAHDANRRVEFHILVQTPTVIIESEDVTAPPTDDGVGD